MRDFHILLAIRVMPIAPYHSRHQSGVAVWHDLTGVSSAGFTNRAESEYDPFGAGHSSTSISSALGMAVARDFKVNPLHHCSHYYLVCECHLAFLCFVCALWTSHNSPQLRVVLQVGGTCTLR